MDAISAIAVQQSLQQNNVALAQVKSNAQAKQALADVIVQNTSPQRGQNLDITV